MSNHTVDPLILPTNIISVSLASIVVDAVHKLVPGCPTAYLPNNYRMPDLLLHRLNACAPSLTLESLLHLQATSWGPIHQAERGCQAAGWEGGIDTGDPS